MVLSLSGCATRSAVHAGPGTVVSTPASSSLPPLVDGGRQHTEEVLTAFEVTLDPPDRSVIPKLDGQAAYLVCVEKLSCPSTGVRAPKVTSALITTNNGGIIADHTSVTPLAVKLPGYVLQWQGIPCAPAGGSSVTESAASVLTTCTWIGLIDAMTGKALGSGQTSDS